MEGADRTRWGAVFAIWLAGLTAAGQFSKVGVIFEELAPLWPDAGARLGLVVSVTGLVGIVFGTTAGLLVARLGARRMILGALLAGAALSALQALVLPLGWMIASRVAEGFAHLAIVVAGPVLISGLTAPRDQAAAMTLWSTFFGIAFALTATFGLPFAQMQGPAALFGLHGGLMAAVAVLLAKVLPHESAEYAPVLRLRGILADHWRIYASPRIAAPAMGFIFYTLMFVALLTIVPVQVPAQYRVVTATLMPLVSIVASLGVGVQVVRWLGAVAVVQLGFALAAVAALGWLFAAGLGAVIAALAMSAALGLVQGASFAAIPALNADRADRAMAAGAIAQLGNVGTTLGTPILLAMTTAWGPAAMAWFALPPALAGVAVHQWLALRRR
ncbi:MFS transporter [Phaeovulum sp.]|uniref:MFS transporter n=1 Tax=Phaeovulum sp. TaxID=2934796 RepID=UPI0035673C04